MRVRSNRTESDVAEDYEKVQFDDMLPTTFALSSSKVRRLLDEKLDLVVEMDSLCKKIKTEASKAIHEGSSPIPVSDTENLQTRYQNALDEIRKLRLRLQSDDDCRKENEHLRKRLGNQDSRIQSAVEERDTLVNSLRLALDKEEFKRLRVQAQYDEEKVWKLLNFIDLFHLIPCV